MVAQSARRRPSHLDDAPQARRMRSNSRHRPGTRPNPPRRLSRAIPARCRLPRGNPDGESATGSHQPRPGRKQLRSSGSTPRAGALRILWREGILPSNTTQRRARCPHQDSRRAIRSFATKRQATIQLARSSDDGGQDALPAKEHGLDAVRRRLSEPPHSDVIDRGARLCCGNVLTRPMDKAHRPMTQKENGAYYTPARVAATLVAWALRGKQDRMLDPACGDGGVIAHHPSSVGVERCAQAAAAARQRAPDAQVVCADFFAWAASTPSRFDCAAGNPPFIRYQRFSGETRGLARDLCAALGVRLSGLCSSWAPWLLVTASLLRPGGRRRR